MFLLHSSTSLALWRTIMICSKLIPLLGQESPDLSEKAHDFKSFQQTVSSPDVPWAAPSPGQPALPTAALLGCVLGRGRAGRGIYRQPPASHSARGIEKPSGRDTLPGTHCWDKAVHSRDSCSGELKDTYSQSSVFGICELHSPCPAGVGLRPLNPAAF